MGACTKALLNKKVSERDVFLFIKENIALNQDASIEVSVLDELKQGEFGNLYGRINFTFKEDLNNKKIFKNIFFSQSSGGDYQDILGGEGCLSLILGLDDDNQDIMKTLTEHFGGYYIYDDCADEDDENYAIYSPGKFSCSNINNSKSLDSKLWSTISTNKEYKNLLPNFGLIKKLLIENPSLINREFNEGDLVYHIGLKKVGTFEAWDIEDDTVHVTFTENDGHNETVKVTASLLKRII